MILVTTDCIEVKKFEMPALVKGGTIQSVHAGRDVLQGFKTLVGGALSAYNEMMEKVGEIATERMIRKQKASVLKRL